MIKKIYSNIYMYFDKKNNIISISYIIAFLIFYMFQSFFKGAEYLTPEQFIKAPIIGNDLKLTIQMALNDNIIPYSPFVDLAFSLFDLSNFKLMYRIYFVFMILLTLLYSYIIVPKLINQSQTQSFIIILILWISYGFIFELERGQWNIISYILVLISYLLYKKSHKLPAYVIFALAVHLKIYPLIFIVIFFYGISDFKIIINEAMRFLFFIIILFMIQGFDNFIIYLNQLINYTNNVEVCFQNHSIYSFSRLASQEICFLSQDIITYVSLIIYMLILLHMSIKACLSKITFGEILVTLTIGSMIIPSVSYDYKISLLWLSMPIYYFTINENRKFIDNLIIVLIFILFFSTQFSFTNYYYLKMSLLFNKFISIYGILILVYVRTLNFKGIRK